MAKIWSNVSYNQSNFNLNIIKLFSFFIGNNNFFSFKGSGEAFFLDKICNENPQLCLDVGANNGKYSEYILRNSKSKIVAFEPSNRSFKKLVKLKKKYRDRIFFFNLAAFLSFTYRYKRILQYMDSVTLYISYIIC